MRILHAAAFSLLALTACRRGHDGESVARAAPSTSVAAGAQAVAVPPTARAAGASDSAVNNVIGGAAAPSASAMPSAAPSTSAASSDDARLKAYWAQVGAGRSATVRHDYAAAVAAFDRALAALPDDARAYAERGYAQLMAKNYGLAREDFDRAAVRTTDPKLLAQIWFNYGLTAEQEGRPKDAQSAFARSNSYNPTSQAAAKIGDEPVCAARVTTQKEPEQGTKPLGDAAPGTFLSAFSILSAGRSPTQQATTEDQARSLLCPLGTCELAVNQGTPLRLKIGDTTIYGGAVKTSEQELSVTPKLSVSKAGPCGVKEVITTLHQQPLHFRIDLGYSTESFKSESGAVCAEGAACRRECAEGSRIVTDYLFGTDGKRLALTIEQWTSGSGKPPWDIRVEGESARILGSGCDIKWDLR